MRSESEMLVEQLGDMMNAVAHHPTFITNIGYAYGALLLALQQNGFSREEAMELIKAHGIVANGKN